MVKTRVSSNRSPWLSSFKLGDEFTIPVSHGEGKFVVGDEQALKLFEMVRLPSNMLIMMVPLQ